eukprot:12836735-Alexandrium_andersonii.AAC.1
MARSSQAIADGEAVPLVGLGAARNDVFEAEPLQQVTDPTQPPAPTAAPAPAPVRRGDAIEAGQLQQAIDASLVDNAR